MKEGECRRCNFKKEKNISEKIKQKKKMLISQRGRLREGARYVKEKDYRNI